MSNGGGIGGKGGNFGSEPPEMGIIWSLECPLGVVVSTLIGTSSAGSIFSFW